MALTELQKMVGTGLAFSGGLSISVLIYSIKRKSNIVNSFSVKLANCILLFAMFHELISGYLHFVYPYNCHHYISGLPAGLGIKDDINAMTGMALMTSVWGGTSIILGLAMMIPFLVDVNLFITQFLLVGSLLLRSIGFLNLQTGILNDLSKNVPAYMMNTYSSWENVRKTPPGKHLHLIKIVLLLFGVIFSLIGEQKKIDESKKSKKLS